MNSGENQEVASRLRFYLLHFAPRKLFLHLRMWIKDSQFFTHPFWLSRQSKLKDNDSSFSCQQRTSLEGKKRKTFSHFPKVIRYNRCTCSKLHEMMVHFTHWLGSVVCNPELETVVENCLQTTLQFAKIFKNPFEICRRPNVPNKEHLPVPFRAILSGKSKMEAMYWCTQSTYCLHLGSTENMPPFRLSWPGMSPKRNSPLQGDV